MPASDPLQILLAHDRWATEQLLAACGRLTEAQFHHRFDIGPGSLHAASTHVIGAMRTWSDTLAETPVRPRIEDDGEQRTPAQLLKLLDETCRAFAAEAGRRPVEEQVTRQMRTGRVATFTRGLIVSHVITHGMHHRAQCLNMLRHLGVDPLPPSSVTEWTWAGEP